MNKKTSLKLLIVFLSFIFSLNINANNLTLNQQVKDKNTIKYSLLYHRVKDLDTEKNIIFKKFKTLPESKSFGVLNGEYWFQLTLDKTANAKNLVAYIPTHNIDKIDVYQVENETLKYVTSTGNSISRDQLPINYKFPAFKINTKDNPVFYLKVYFPKEANFPLNIIEEENFVSYIMNKKTINSFYYGTCIVIIFLNLFFFLRFRDKSYLFYLLFISSLMFNFLLYDGSIIAFYRGNSFYYKLELITHLSNSIWFILFSIKFLNLNIKHPFYFKLLFIFPIIVTIFYAFYLNTNLYIYAAIGDAFGITLLPILWLFGIYYIKQIPYAKFYVLGYLLLIPLAVFFIIGFPFGLWEVNGEMLIIKIASWFDMFVFTYALSFKMKSQSEENKRTITYLQNTILNSKSSIINSESTKVTDPYLSLLKENEISTTPLTLREIDITRTICDGLTNAQISEKLFISNNTVKYHIRNIYTKVNVNNRNELKAKISLH